MRNFIVCIILATFTTAAFAGWFSSEDSRVKAVTTTHATVGTTTASAIASASVVGDVYGFLICNDPVNASSTYLAVGQAVDVTTDGVRLDKGACYECLNCKPAILKLINVEGQGASNGYSVIQLKR